MDRSNENSGSPEASAVRSLCEQFNRSFAHWRIELNPSDLSRGKSAFISSQGWAIWTLYAEDKDGEYLDYYAAHRMTNDRHVRIRADGTTEHLPAINTMRILSKDPEENARLGEEFVRHNRQVDALLREKGFGMTGMEPVSISINRYLVLEDEE
jgi:hypothetical protein